VEFGSGIGITKLELKKRLNFMKWRHNQSAISSFHKDLLRKRKRKEKEGKEKEKKRKGKGKGKRKGKNGTESVMEVKSFLL